MSHTHTKRTQLLNNRFAQLICKQPFLYFIVRSGSLWDKRQTNNLNQLKRHKKWRLYKMVFLLEKCSQWKVNEFIGRCKNCILRQMKLNGLKWKKSSWVVFSFFLEVCWNWRNSHCLHGESKIGIIKPHRIVIHSHKERPTKNETIHRHDHVKQIYWWMNIETRIMTSSLAIIHVSTCVQHWAERLLLTSPSSAAADATAVFFMTYR